MRTVHALRGAVAALAAFLIVGCAPEQDGWRLTNITGLMPELTFTLTDHTGEAATGEDFRGGPVLMYFGYTHCPDVCPTTLATVRSALGQLNNEASQVTVLFVTVDPERDTRGALSRYVNAFGPQFVGLRGKPSQLKDLTRRYRVVYNRDKPDADGDYLVAHSSALFVFDREGRPRLVARPDDDAEAIASDLSRLLADT
ncbi:SCO family protein [Thiohalorhabdus sp.]|uniref:SCO family protein n=1 Tax=Thiohalorhabdus sp. TaxID=3094134 RepID=UPI002FC2BF46